MSDSGEIKFSQNIGNNIVKKFRLARVAERFVNECEKYDPTLGIIPPSGHSGRSPNALVCEQPTVL